MTDQKKRVCLITGGSSGIGRALMVALAADGWTTVDASRRGSQTDVTRPYQVAELVSHTLTAYGRIDALVCAAGVAGEVGYLETQSLASWEHTVQVNLFGTAHACRSVLWPMKRARGGRIVTFSGGGVGGPNLARDRTAYVASKAAVVALTEALSHEVSPFGIAINCIAPGLVATPMTHHKGDVPEKHAVPLVRWLLNDAPLTVTGRFLSAVWDAPYDARTRDMGPHETKLRRAPHGMVGT